MIGKHLGNRYQILEQLGGGGMSVVYKAKDTFLNRLVTVKVLRPEYLSDTDFIHRFRREAQAVAKLSHPNIVHIHDVGQQDETHYLVMEYIDGDNLKNFMRENPHLALDKIINIIKQICEALRHAHQNNIVHQDVKPHNILITDDQRVKLTDFGIALEATTGTITNSGVMMGSVHYISPEQAQGNTSGPQSDIYGLGVVLYEMLTGQLPFKGDSAVMVALKHVQEQPVNPRELNQAISPDLERVVLKAMAKDPAQRYQNARQFSDELQCAVPVDWVQTDLEADFATQVLPEDNQPLPRPRRKIQLTRVAIIVFLVLLSILGGIALALYNYLDVAEIKVPAVEGLPLNEAVILLENEGFGVAPQEVYDQTEKGLVITQDIAPGTLMKKGRVVELTVSLGPEFKTLPNVQGILTNDARIALHNAGFKYHEEQVFSEKKAGMVVEQNPLPGEHPKGTTVELLVSKGPAPVVHTMPTLISLTLNQTQTKLFEFNLILDEPALSDQPSEEFLKGMVIAQNPQPGAKVVAGSAVAVVLSAGPGPPRRDATIRVVIDDHVRSQKVRITVTDIRGEQNVYVATHTAGEVVVRTVEYYSPAVIRVYLDGELAEERQF